MLVGCDVLLFYLVGEDLFSEIDLDEEFSFVIKFFVIGGFEFFLKEKLVRIFMVVYWLIKEIEYVLNYEELMMYKFW